MSATRGASSVTRTTKQAAELATRGLTVVGHEPRQQSAFLTLLSLTYPCSLSSKYACPCCTDWESTVHRLAQQLSKELGIADTAHVEAQLQKVSVVVNEATCIFDPSASAPPGTFATLVILCLPRNAVCPCLGIAAVVSCITVCRSLAYTPLVNLQL